MHSYRTGNNYDRDIVKDIDTLTGLQREGYANADVFPKSIPGTVPLVDVDSA